MPTLTLNSSFVVSSDLISTSEFVSRYMNGLSLATHSGSVMTSQIIQSYISNAISQLEMYLDIKLRKQIITETKDFVSLDWQQWSVVRTSYPINDVFELMGVIGQTPQVSYPKDWLTIRRQNDNTPQRSVFVVAGASNSNAQPVLFQGTYLYHMMASQSWIPNYWQITYCTGFDKVPANIIDLIGKVAAINAMSVIGDATYKPGLGSQSLSIDGLSQSISPLSSSQGGIYAGRVKQYQEEAKQTLIDLRAYYRGLMMVVC